MQAQNQDYDKKKQMKTLLCQVAPQLHQKTKNIERVKISLKNYSESDKIDVILFPQTAFTGYNFQDEKDAAKQAVQFGKGQQFQFAISLAKRCKCYVIFGYVEKVKKEGKQILYNSAGVIDREGKPIMNYRKTFLYFCDKLWAKDGQQFGILEVTNVKGQNIKCAIGICMDINPKDFTSGQYEFGDFILKNKIEAFIFPTNWTDHDSGTGEIVNQDPFKQNQSLLHIYNYWLHRLRPVLEAKHKLLFLCADRVGMQYSFFDKRNVWFFGGSCSIMLNPTYIIKNLGKRKQGYLMIEAQI